MIAYAHTSLRVLGSWFCVVVWRVGVQYSSRCCVVARVLVWRVCGCVCGGAAHVCARPPLGGVLWRFPTLPHPLGCSTIGAAGLSFQVRNVAGRFPGAVTTTSLCRPPPLLLARRVAGFPGPPFGWVGGGLVVVRIVVAAPPRPPPLPCCRVLARACGPGGGGGCLVARPPPCWPRSSCPGLAVLLFVAVFAVWRGGCRGWGGLVWCRPISTSRLASASRRFHLWPIDPLFWRGPLTPCGGVETSSRSGLPA